MKKCGYSFWGYLGDVKYDVEGNIARTPDGNAFYSWCIINELHKRGYDVVRIMPDRDAAGYFLDGKFLFSTFAMEDRAKVYSRSVDKELQSMYDFIETIRIDKAKVCESKKSVYDQIKSFIIVHMKENFESFEFILHEYRMLIPGRNDLDSIFDIKWQPDYLIQQCIFEYCCAEKKRLILFDLDYKLEFDTYRDLRSRGCPAVVFELGAKWQRNYFDITYGSEIRQVYIPFDFDHIFDIDLPTIEHRYKKLVYVGNRYERDWCIDKYIPECIGSGCVIYGNWLENGRDSSTRWEYLNFEDRLQVDCMPMVYRSSISTILLAKEEYCRYGFMTARILESVFYGTVPFFIEEYGKEVINKFAGKYAEFLTVSSKCDVVRKINKLSQLGAGTYANRIIEYLRRHLRFMDVRYFVDEIMEVVK